MIYNIIATGSDGNCTILNYSLAVDMGVPFKAIKHDAGKLKLVLLTHEHSDHFCEATIRRLAFERPALRFGCCPWLVDKLLSCGVRRENIDVYSPGKTSIYAAQGLYVCPVETPHNVPNCAYKIRMAGDNGGTVFYATDCGSLDGITAKNFDLYLVEANHTQAEIEERAAAKEAQGLFAYERKAAENHLSMEQAEAWLADNMAFRSVWIPMHGHREKGGGDDGGAPNVCENDRPV